MFEGKPPVPPSASGSKRGDSARDELSVMSWSDLTAKLAAARDLRGELAESDAIRFASFDPEGAAHIASHQEKFPEESKPNVNPDALVNRKGTGGNVVGRDVNDDPAIRGNA